MKSLVLLLSVLVLNGCAVGVFRVSAPDRLPSKSLPLLMRPISFDVCIPRDPNRPSTFETVHRARVERIRSALAQAARKGRGERIRSALAQAGVPAELKSSAEAPVDVTITLGEREDGGGWTLGLSMLTFSIIPGQVVWRSTLEVDFASTDSAPVRRSEHRDYQSRQELFTWLPLIVHPDVVGTLGGVWESSKKEEAAFNQTVGRLGDDIRVRFGRAGEMPPTGAGTGVVCP